MEPEKPILWSWTKTGLSPEGKKCEAKQVQ